MNLSKSPARPAILVFRIAAIAFSALATVAIAQAPSMTGLPPFSTFDSDTFSSINLSNLNVHFDLPLRSLPGRGVPFNAYLIRDTISGSPNNAYGPGSPIIFGGGSSSNYASFIGGFAEMGIAGGSVSFDSTGSVQCLTPPNSTGGRTNLGSYTTYTNFTYVDKNGTLHAYPGVQLASNVQSSQPSQSAPCPYFNPNPSTGSGQVYPADGSPYVLNVTQTATVPTAYVIDSSSGMINDSIDTYGNQNTYSYTQTTATVIDSSGNPALEIAGTTTETTFSYIGPDGSAKNIVATLTATPNPAESINCPGITDQPLPDEPWPATVYLLSSLAYPDGTSYSFTYDTLGRPNTVTLPTGALITYDYNGPNMGVSCTDGGTSGFTKTTPDGTWTYSRTYSSSTSLWTTTVTDPLGDQTVYTFGGGTSAGVIGGNSSQYEISRIQYQNINGNQVQLKKTVTCYNGNFANCDINPSPTQVGNYVGPPTQKDTYTYLPGLPSPSLSEIHYLYFNMPTEDKEYDFGVAVGTAPAITTLISDRNIQYGIYKCVSSDITTDGSGNTWASSSSVCDTHGNATSTKRWVQGSTYVTTSSKFSPTTGVITSTTDGNNNTTNYTYTDPQCNESFPSTINSSGLSTTIIWNCAGEVPTSSTDPNKQVTTFSYADSSGAGDPFWRLRETIYPDGGNTTTDYPPLAGTNTITTSQKVDSTHTVTTSTLLDGLGRPISQFLTSDPYGQDEVDTSYDTLGRVLTVSNPYQQTSDSSYGQTTYAYDALGRTTKATAPDGTSKTYTYSGKTSTLTNEKGNQWQSTTDALGRLTSVSEPNGYPDPTSLPTSYAYDPLGNLTKVTQNGVNNIDTPRTARTFSYDGLSRLVSAYNPESGTVTYVYDGDGNVIQKTGPLPNSASGTQTLGYCYDAWNHLVGKWSAAPPTGCNATPASITTSLLATYTYGTSSTNNTAGRLTDEKAYLNGTVVSENTPNTYDPIGRPLTQTSTPFSPSGSQYTLSNTYNAAGGVTSSGNSATGITLSYGFDSANRLNSVKSNMTSYNAQTFPSTLYSVNSYGAVDVNQATYAGDPTTTGFFNLYRHYDKRGRVLDNEVYPNTTAFGTATVTISGGECSTATAVCGPPYQQGTVTVTAGVTETYSYGNGGLSADTPSTIAEALAAAFNQNPLSTVSASASDSGPANSPCQGGLMGSPASPCAVLTLTAIQLGQYGNIAFAASTSTGSSFSTLASGAALSGGKGSPQGLTSAYVYSLSYDAAGNVNESADPTNGEWFYGYDALNRLKSAAFSNYEGTGIQVSKGTATYQCWAYDSFGNRLFETDLLAAANPAGCPASQTAATATHWATYNANNQVSTSDTAVVYDDAGNVTQDALNHYAYDAEGRICAVKGYSGAMTQYVYDAEGGRAARGTITAWPASGAACAAPTAANGFTLTSSYLRGVTGQEDAEIASATGAWRRNVFGPGGLLASYNFTNSGATPMSLSFVFNDWLGTKRLEVNQSGQLVNWWSSDPFGNYLTPYNTTADPNEQHFTGQERDTESGNDYFGARYYASSMGRFLSPDWESGPDTVPYADWTNPQSLNLYSYGYNNSLAMTDPDGHVPCDGMASITITVTPTGSSMSQSADDCPTSSDLIAWDLMQTGLIPSKPIPTPPPPPTQTRTPGECADTPLAGNPRVTTQFGAIDASHPTKPHTGRDYAAPIGTPVYAPISGGVTYAGNAGTFGNVVAISAPLVTDSASVIYEGHLSSVSVTPGQHVNAGDQIGLSGNTGHSTGPHVHHEQHTPGPVWQNGHPPSSTLIDPCN